MSNQDLEQDAQSTTTLIASEVGWPSIEMAASVYRGRDRRGRNKLDIAAIYTEFKRAFADNDLDLTVIGHTRAVLLDHGVLDIPLLMAHGEKGVAVFIYPEGDPMDAGHFAGVCDVLQRDDFDPPVCYAPSPLPPSRSLDPLEPLRIDMFRELENDQAPNGTYAMWWPTEDETLFSTSKTYDYISQFYQALNGVESYFLGHTLDTLGIKQATDIQSNRVPLSSTPWILPLLGPELVPVYFVADDTRGIQFYLHADTTTVMYRQRFWRLVLEMAMRLRRQVEGAGLEMDEYPDEDAYPLNWWLTAEQSVQMRESQGVQLEYFGGLEALLEDGELPTTTGEDAPEQITEEPAKSSVVTQVLYTCIVILIVIWTIVAGLTLFKKDPVDPAQAGIDPPAAVEMPPPTVQEVPEDEPPSESSQGVVTAVATEAPAEPPVEAPAEAVTQVPEAQTEPEQPVELPEVVADEDEPEPPPAVLPKGAPVPLEGKAVYRVVLTRPAAHAELGANATVMLVQERNQAKVMDVRRRTVLRTVAGDRTTLSADGTLVASSAEGVSTISVSVVETGRRLQGLRFVTEPLDFLGISPDNKYLLAWGGAQRQMAVWSIETGEELARLVMPEDVTIVKLSPDSQQLAAIAGSELQIYALPDLSLMKRSQTGLTGMREPEFSGDGKMLAVIYEAGIGIIDTATWQRSRLVVFDTHPRAALAVNEDGTLLAVTSGEELLSIWQNATNRWQTYQHPVPALDIYLSEARSALGVRTEKQMLFWELKSVLDVP